MWHVSKRAPWPICNFAPTAAIRHPLAWGDFRLNAPFVTSSIKPRSWSSANARCAVPHATLQRSEPRRTDNPN